MKFEYLVVFLNSDQKKQKFLVIAESLKKGVFEASETLGQKAQIVSCIRKASGILETKIH